MDVVTVRIPHDVKTRLYALKTATGKSISCIVRQALDAYLGDLDYIHTLEKEAAAARLGKIDTYTLKEIEDSLDT